MAIPQMKKKKVEMVETEMGRMVPKAAQQKFEKEATEAMNKQYFSRGKDLKSMSKNSNYYIIYSKHLIFQRMMEKPKNKLAGLDKTKSFKQKKKI